MEVQQEGLQKAFPEGVGQHTSAGVHVCKQPGHATGHPTPKHAIRPQQSVAPSGSSFGQPASGGSPESPPESPESPLASLGPSSVVASG